MNSDTILFTLTCTHSRVTLELSPSVKPKVQTLKFNIVYVHDDIIKTYQCCYIIIYVISYVSYASEREMCPWAISKYFGDLVSNTSAKM
jgi:hypothetical protein